MRVKIPNQRPVRLNVSEATRFDCLIAAILATAVLGFGTERPEQVFQIYGELVQMIPRS